MLLKIVISFIPVMIIAIFGIATNKIKKDINNLLKLILYSFFMIYILIILGELLKTIFEYITAFIILSIPNISLVFLKLLQSFFVAALPEEVLKWFFIKKSNPKNKYEIIFNCIFISAMFMALENSIYMLSFSSNLIGIHRAFLPVHLACQLIMALLMICLYNKNNDNDNDIKESRILKLSILFIPIVLHTLYNTIITFSKIIINVDGIEIHPIAVIIGICIYVIVFILMINYGKLTEYSGEKTDKSKLVKRIIAIIVLFIVWSVLFFGKKDNEIIIESNNYSNLLNTY